MSLVVSSILLREVPPVAYILRSTIQIHQWIVIDPLMREVRVTDSVVIRVNAPVVAPVVAHTGAVVPSARGILGYRSVELVGVIDEVVVVDRVAGRR